MEIQPTPNRRHDLDALRAFAMLLGIALHAALSFTGGFWMVQDSKTSGGFHLLTSAVHGFRMPLFFVLSGFFTAMLWRRRGLRELLVHRFKRVLLPLLAGLVTVMPLMHVIGGLANHSDNGQVDKTPSTLWKACAKGDHKEVAGFVAQGADVNAPDPAFGVTPLTYAALFGRESVVLWLLDHGADARRTNRDGGTALHAAAFLGRESIARELLKAGADPAAKNQRGEIALDTTMADWDTTQFIARMLKIPLEKDALQKGRAEVRLMLGGSEMEPKSRPLLGLWLFLTQQQVFAHLWFLWFLCWMVAGFTVCAWLVDRLGWKSVPRSWVSSPLRYLWLVPLTMIPAWFMGRAMPNFGPDTSSSLLPPLYLLAYYAVFFGFGALYFDSQDERVTMGRRWWLTLPLALLAVYPLGLYLTHQAGGQWRGFAVLLQVIYVWMMSAAMMGLFSRYVSQERRWVRYLSDASYWLYIAHLPLVIAAQLWVRDWQVAAGWKFLLICGGVFAVLLLSYEYAVRYTWVGAFLNGRKHRQAATTR